MVNHTGRVTMRSFTAVLALSFSVYSQMFTIKVNQNVEIVRPENLQSVREYTCLECEKSDRYCTGTISAYDSLGRLVEKVEIEDDSYNGRTVYAYNKWNKLANEIEYDEKDEVQDKNTWGYDSSGRLVEYIDWSDEGTIDRRMIYTYFNDNTYKAVQYDDDNKVECVYEYLKPDERGNYTLEKIKQKNNAPKYIKKAYKYYK